MSMMKRKFEEAQNLNYYVIAVRYPAMNINGMYLPESVEFTGDPDHSRNDILTLVREGLEDGRKIEFVHHITMDAPPVDLTEELVSEAQDALLEAAE